VSLSDRARQRAAKVAGWAFLVYIAAGLAESILFESTLGSGAPLTKLANANANASTLRLTVVLSLVSIFSALVLAVTLFAVTFSYGPIVALAGLVGRTAEGVIGCTYALTTAGLVSTARFSAAGEFIAGSESVAVLLLAIRHESALLSALCFAVGSAAFAYLLIRGRAVSAALAWFGLAASVLLMIVLPAQMATGVHGLLAIVLWLPMLMFELVLAVWLIVRGLRRDDGAAQIQSMQDRQGSSPLRG